MPLSIFLLVLAAAALHASWNAIVKRGPDKFLGTVLVTGSAALLSAAALPFLPFPAAHSWPWLAASVLLQVTYYGLVARCYQQVDMSLAYPLMRGSAPILVALAGTLLGEQLPAAAWLGVVLVSTGILCMALGARGGQLRLPLLTAAMIATYTLVDAQGARQSGSALSYTLWLFLLSGIPAAAVGAVHARRRGAGLCAAALAAGTGRWRRHHRLVCDGVVGHDPGAGGDGLGAARILDPVRAADLGVPAARADPRARWLAASLIVGGVLALRLA
jgi:drug/metabolite transporter (DMT)-like permease